MFDCRKVNIIYALGQIFSSVKSCKIVGIDLLTVFVDEGLSFQLGASLAYQQQCIAGHNHVDIRFSGSSLVEQSPVAVGGKIIYFVVSALGDEVLSV